MLSTFNKYPKLRQTTVLLYLLNLYSTYVYAGCDSETS
jgi:hypothetical protein